MPRRATKVPNPGVDAHSGNGIRYFQHRPQIDGQGQCGAQDAKSEHGVAS
jgi:hypothetical protein